MLGYHRQRRLSHC